MSRTVNRVSWFLTILGVALAGTVAFGLHRQAGADRRSFLDVSGSGKNASIVWVGDTMLGDAVQERLDAEGYAWPFKYVAPLLEADVTVANYEATMTTRDEIFDKAQRWSYLTSPAVAAALSHIGVDVLNMANNHAMDGGPEGLADTLEHAASAGLRTFGAGADLLDASKPVLIRTRAGTLALVGFAEFYGEGDSAGRSKPGTLTLSRRAIRDAFTKAKRAGADWVVAGVHWGENYATVEELQRQWAREFANAGYSMVVGSGPHVAHPIDVLGPMPVLYSLGNFVFTSPGRYDTLRASGLGLVLRLELSVDRPPLMRLHCIVADNREVAYQPRPCARQRSVTLLESLSPHVVMEGDAGVLRCDPCFPPPGPARPASAAPCGFDPCPRPEPRSPDPALQPGTGQAVAQPAAPPAVTPSTPTTQVAPPRRTRREPAGSATGSPPAPRPVPPPGTVPVGSAPAEGPPLGPPSPSVPPPVLSPAPPPPEAPMLSVTVTCEGVEEEMERGDSVTVTFEIDSTAARRVAVRTALVDRRGRDRSDDTGQLDVLTIHPGRTTVTLSLQLPPELKRGAAYKVVGQLWSEEQGAVGTRVMLAQSTCGSIEIED